MIAETPIHPVTELHRFTCGSIEHARAKSRFAEVLGWEACQDIAADIATHHQKVAELAYSAECHAREALKLIDEAMLPESDGGELITPKEAKRIRRFIEIAADKGHDASERAKV